MLKLNKKYLLAFSSILFCVHFQNCKAWEHEVSAGYGFGREIGQSYYNHGISLSGKFYKTQIDKTLIATLDGTLASWTAGTPTDKYLNTAALAIGLRGYFADPAQHKIKPYLGVSWGPAYLSNQHFGTREQGSSLAMQVTLETGIEIKNFDVNLHLAHYCNAGLANPNQAINVPFVLSIGYLF
jgi:hypothetical protein